MYAALFYDDAARDAASGKRASMFVLRRKVGERFIIDGTITITVEKIRGSTVVLSIAAPPSIGIVRAEAVGTREGPKNQEASLDGKGQSCT